MCKVCTKCHFYVALVLQEFVQKLYRFNFPSLKASATPRCYSCGSLKIVPCAAINDYVREMVDFHSSPEPGAAYFACMDCLYKTQKYAEYKKLVAKTCGVVSVSCVDALIGKLKRRKQSRKQLTLKTYKIGNLPKLPRVCVRLEQLVTTVVPAPPPLNRSGRPIKRRLDDDFEYDEITAAPEPKPRRRTALEKSKTKNKVPNGVSNGHHLESSPLVVLERIKLSPNKNYKLLPSIVLSPSKLPTTPEEPISQETPPPLKCPLGLLQMDEAPQEPPIQDLVDDDDDDQSSLTASDVAPVLEKSIEYEEPYFGAPDVSQSQFYDPPNKSVSFSEQPPEIFYFTPDADTSDEEIQIDDLLQDDEPLLDEDDDMSSIIESVLSQDDLS